MSSVSSVKRYGHSIKLPVRETGIYVRWEDYATLLAAANRLAEEAMAAGRIPDRTRIERLNDACAAYLEAAR